MDPLAALFGIACLITLACAALAPAQDRRDAMLLAIILLIEWAASNLAWLAGAMQAFALQDALVLGLCLFLFRHQRHGWRLRFSALAAIQLLFDIANELGGFAAYTLWALLQDATAAAQLIIVSGPGANHVRICVAAHHRRRGHPG